MQVGWWVRVLHYGNLSKIILAFGGPWDFTGYVVGFVTTGAVEWTEATKDSAIQSEPPDPPVMVQAYFAELWVPIAIMGDEQAVLDLAQDVLHNVWESYAPTLMVPFRK